MKAPALKSAAVKISVVLLTVLLMAGSTLAAGIDTGNKKMTKEGIANILAGIKSENNGVKRDCIYFSALYDIKDAVDVLSEQLENEKDSRTCVLISLALYKLNSENSPVVDSGSSLTDWNDKVHLLSDEIVTTITNKNSGIASSDNK